MGNVICDEFHLKQTNNHSLAAFINEITDDYKCKYATKERNKYINNGIH
jgi:hypothetical protein